jgi:hypothetical protein
MGYYPILVDSQQQGIIGKLPVADFLHRKRKCGLAGAGLSTERQQTFRSYARARM